MQQPGAAPPRRSFAQRFLRLYLAGLLGIAALPLAIVPLLRLNAADLSMRAPLLTVLSLVQPAILLAAAVALGCTLAHKLQLKSLLASAPTLALAWQQLRPYLPQALLLGAGAGAVVMLADLLVFRLLLPSPWFEKAAAAQPGALSGLVVGVLYGGITEELLLRWGLMTLIAWALWKTFRRRHVLPGNAVMLAAITLAALLFAAGHLPAAAQIQPLDAVIVTRVLLLNFIGGVVFGWLYWRWSLEAAMVAHAGAHLAFFVTRISGLA
jgi:membrane protease YdiL (CAAX protease family)